jgi:hypothetical protein
MILSYQLFDGIPALPKNFSSKGNGINSEARTVYAVVF